MLGANPFGAPYFGEEFVFTSIPLSADATVGFSTQVTFNPGTNFKADATIAFSTNAAASGRTRFDVDSTVSFSTSTFLGIQNRFMSTSTLGVSAEGTLLILSPLSNNSTIPFSVDPPKLTIGAHSISSDSNVNFSTVTFLSNPPVLSSDTTVPFSTVANLTDIGVGVFTTQFTINAVHVESRVRFDTISINDVLNEEPNTLNFTINGAAPTVGSDVKVGLLNLATANLVFGGTIIDVRETYDSTIGNLAWHVDCRDYTYLLNRRAIWKRYDNVSATTIVLDLMANYSQGFTTINVAGGLPAITIALSGGNLSDALTQIDALAGTYHYIDYGRDLHVFVTEAANAPDAINATNTVTLIDPPLTLTSTTDQVRNRILVQGHSANVNSPSGFAIPANVTVLPIDDASAFSSGQAFIEPSDQVISYTGTSAGGTTAVVVANQITTGATPPAPTVSLLNGTAGHISGSHIWKIAFGNSTGESNLGNASTNLFCPDISQPTLAPGVGATGTVGPLVGTYKYAITNLTTLGETQIGPFSTRTAPALAAPSQPAVSTAAGPGNLVVGSTYGYKTTFVTTFGETPMSSGTAFYTPEVLQKPALSLNSGVTFGNLIGSSYTYGISFVTQFGEATDPAILFAGGPFATNAPGGNIFWSGTQDTAGRVQPGFTYVWAYTAYNLQYGETPLSIQFSLNVSGGVPIRLLMTTPFNFSDPNIDGFRAYRAIAGNPFFLEFDFRRGNIGNGGQYFSVANQNELINPFPVSQLVAGQKEILNVFPSGELGVVARRIYRSKAGGSDLFFIGEIQNNFFTTFFDNVADSQLTVRNPVVQTTGRQAQLTSIPTGGSGVIGRRVYRTKANGSAYYPVADIRDNVTTSIIDTLPDSALGGSTGPGTNTAGGDQHLLTSIQTGVAGTLGRRIYRTVANGSEFKFLAQLSDNATSTYVDNLPDESLGVSAPLVSTAGSSAVSLVVPVGPSGITQRLIYRTPANNTTDFKYAGTINNNSTTAFTDTLADTDLGRLPPPSATIGVLPGDLSISLSPSASGFTVPGWAIADSQLIYYTGITGNTLTGIPPLTKVSSITRSLAVATMTTLTAHGFITNQSIVVFGANEQQYNGSHTVTVTGPTTCTFPISILAATAATGVMTTSAPGAVIGSLSGGTSVVAAAELTGVSGLTMPVNPGDNVSLWVTCNDLSSQATMASIEGGDGIHEAPIVDSALLDVASCTKRGNAELALFSLPLVTLTYATRDTKTRSGKTIAVNLPAPLNIVTSLKILDVTIDQFSLVRTFPRFRVNKASNAKFSIADLIRHVVLK